ncbi:MAG: V-type ATP synthase subunit D [Syntrophorhabdaceae bacterium]|nr:V-type ATP synthase subunit D [Syntrophorhabdaceae bacterium]MDD4195432.1 V-type ATP synthase subunit D [Syntrophorhabdaceae bacterium]
MAKLNIAPTKSNLLNLERQLDFAQEGYDLLEQKRQILIFELMSRLNRAEEAERKVAEALRQAFEALREATLDVGSEAIDRVTLGIAMKHKIELSDDRLMGMGVPKVTVRAEHMGVRFGVTGTSSNTDLAMNRFVDVLPLLAELAELENAVMRLARELRRTQRRTNALSKIFIPQYRETIDYIMGSLEERERESLIILKMIRDRLET